MRTQFFKFLGKLAEKDKKIIFLTGDLGFGYFEEFRDKFPNQFINCGTIEQSMVGIAAGLAKAGKKPYVYSTAPFILFRAYEQLRNDVAYQNLNVKLIGVSVSGFLGFSHNLQGKENEYDLLKNLPNIKYYEPILDSDLLRDLIVSYELRCPAYIKL
jgi:transketolase